MNELCWNESKFGRARKDYLRKTSTEQSESDDVLDARWREREEKKKNQTMAGGWKLERVMGLFPCSIDRSTLAEV